MPIKNLPKTDEILYGTDTVGGGEDYDLEICRLAKGKYDTVILTDVSHIQTEILDTRDHSYDHLCVMDLPYFREKVGDWVDLYKPEYGVVQVEFE